MRIPSLTLRIVALLALAAILAGCSSPTTPLTPTEDLHPTLTAIVDMTQNAPTATPVAPANTALPPTVTSASGTQSGAILIFPPYESPTGYLLGGFQEGSWQDAAAVAAMVHSGDSFKLYSDRQSLENATAGAPSGSPICPEIFSVEMEHSSATLVAFRGDWNPLPRIPQESDPADPEATRLVGDYLAAQGISQPQVQIQRILQVDLEGDGVAEQVIAANRFEEPSGHEVTPGDYTLILLARSGQAPLPVVAEWYSRADALAFPDRFELSGLLDLNGDGRMEILVAVAGWEKTGSLAFEVNGGQVTKVLQARCP